jgi:acyl carrier protein
MTEYDPIMTEFDPTWEPRLRGLLHPWLDAGLAARIDRDADLVQDLRIDSLSALEFLAAVEQEFGMLLADEKLHQLRTLNHVLAEIAVFEDEFGDVHRTTASGQEQCGSA